jgi:pSer/pThr/pTyr-binding forkhead associated (FHA) protein
MFKLELTLQNLVLKEYVLSDGAKLSTGSKNGTIVNGTKVESAELHHGNIVRIGKNCTIKVSVPSQKKKESTITGEHDQKTSTLKTSEL